MKQLFSKKQLLEEFIENQCYLSVLFFERGNKSVILDYKLLDLLFPGWELSKRPLNLESSQKIEEGFSQGNFDKIKSGFDDLLEQDTDELLKNKSFESSVADLMQKALIKSGEVYKNFVENVVIPILQKKIQEIPGDEIELETICLYEEYESNPQIIQQFL